MPPRPGHHLDLYLVTQGRLPADEALNQALGRLAEPQASRELVDGGFAGVRVDRPLQRTLYANRQGGFRVACPACGGNLAPAFGGALTLWRAGGPFALTCATCGVESRLDTLRFSPAAAFGDGAVVLIDARSFGLTERGQAVFTELLGPFDLVGSRR